MQGIHATPRRNRQFSRVREDFSNRSAMSRSQIDPNRSINASAYTKQSRIGKTDKKQIPQYHNYSFHENQKNKKNKSLCTDCFNKQFAKAKRQLSRREYDQEKRRNRTSLINQEDGNHQKAKSRFDRQYEATQKTNLKLIQEHQKKKMKEKMDRQKANELISKTFLENKTMQQERDQMMNKKREQLKRQLQEQIKEVAERRRLQTIQAHKQIVPMFDNFEKVELKKNAEDRYRQDLLMQIEQKRKQKKIQDEEQQKRKRNEELQLQALVQQKKAKIKQQTERRRYLQMEEQKRIKARSDQKKRDQMRKKKQIEEEVQRQMMATAQQWREKESAKKNQITSYLHELRKQIDDNKERKQNINNWYHQPTNTSPLLQKPDVLERACDSCEKKYPQMYLTKVSDPFEL